MVNPSKIKGKAKKQDSENEKRLTNYGGLGNIESWGAA
jgi:hypothetical protein